MLIKLGSLDTSPIIKNGLENKGTLVRNMKTRSQATRFPQIQIPEEEGVQSDDKSCGEGNFNIEDIGKEAILFF